MAAAVAAYDSGIRNLCIIDREEKPGGILKQCIHNGFGLHKFGRELTGPEYAALYEEQVSLRNIPFLCNTTVTGLTQSKLIIARNETGILQIQAKSVILAMGCRERSRGALNIPGTRPAGVYSAGTAQKLMNIEGYTVGKQVVILGSGDIGLIMARRMSLEGARVRAVCEVMPYSGGLKRNIVQCLEDFDIPLFLSTTVTRIHGKNRVEGVTVAQVDEHRNPIPGTSRFIPCDTLLLSVGLIPENELTKQAGIALDPVTGGALVDEHRQTTVDGIFACGNVLQVHDLVDYVSDEAEIAGKGAALFIQHSDSTGCGIKTFAGRKIRYVLPQRIAGDPAEGCSLFFRVSEPVNRRVKYIVSSPETVLTTAVRLKAAPGEMEKIFLKPEQLAAASAEITVSMEELP